MDVGDSTPHLWSGPRVRTKTESSRSRERGAFCISSGPVDVAVVIVSYQSAADLPGLLESLRVEAVDLKMRVVVAGNCSTDGSIDLASNEPDITVVGTGENLCYAAAINVAMSHVGEAPAILVLNPDLTVDAGCVSALLSRLREAPAVGIVVPKILDPSGRLFRSLRREPGLLRAAADAALGSRWLFRPGWLSESVRDDPPYSSAQEIDWATGAAMLVARPAWDLIGQWDEHFFLCFAQADFCRRARNVGISTWYEPAATVRHKPARPRASDTLAAQANADRLRYVEKHQPHTARLHRILFLLQRLTQGDHTGVHARKEPWSRPRRSFSSGPNADAPPQSRFPSACVIIPAYNESAVIDRTLASLAQLAQDGTLEVIISCNGCTDDTAARARRYPGVIVLETDEASKVVALNAADAVASKWPRLYLDADIEVSPEALFGTIHALCGGGILAARPEFRYDSEGASAPVRAYLRARQRMPSMSQGMWGAGVYGISRAGHEVLGAFPSVTADDLYVDGLFPPGRKRVVTGPPVIVRAPRSAGALLQVLARARRGSAEQAIDTGGSTLRELSRTVTGLSTAADAACYAAFAVLARRRTQRSRRQNEPGRVVWERDDSTRVGDGS